MDISKVRKYTRLLFHSSNSHMDTDIPIYTRACTFLIPLTFPYSTLFYTECSYKLYVCTIRYFKMTVAELQRTGVSKQEFTDDIHTGEVPRYFCVKHNILQMLL